MGNILQFKRKKTLQQEKARADLEALIWELHRLEQVTEAKADRLLADLKYNSGEWNRVERAPFPNRKRSA